MEVQYTFSITDAVQAFAALVTLILALVTYSLSRRSYHTPFVSTLRPVDIIPFEHETKFSVFNSGPGVAYNICLLVDRGTPYAKRIWAQSIGSEEILSRDKGTFLIDKPPVSSGLVLSLEWETISGRKTRTYWICYANERGRLGFKRIGKLTVISKRVKSLLRNEKTGLTPVPR